MSRASGADSPRLASGATRYAIAFLVSGLLLLLSFVAVPGMSISDLPDEFRWHDDLASAIANFRFRVGDRVYKQAVVGKQGWLFFTAEGSMRDYQRTPPLSQEELALFNQRLAELGAAVKGNGRAFLFVVVPNKSTVYSKYMPDEIPVLGTESRLDQMIEYVAEQGTTPGILDLRPALMRQSTTQQIYNKTDTHWNELGAYYAYAEILKTLSTDYPDLVPHPLTGFVIQTIPGGRNSDLPRIVGRLPIRDDAVTLTPRFPAPTSSTSETLPNGVALRITMSQNHQLPSLVIAGDSFSDALIKFLVLNFRRVALVPTGSISGAEFAALVRAEDPDVVIVEVVERYLLNSLAFLKDPGP